MFMQPVVRPIAAFFLAFSLPWVPAGVARTPEERQTRATELVDALNGTATDRADWLRRWASAEEQEGIGGQLQAMAVGGIALVETDFSRGPDRIYLAHKDGSARLDLLPAGSDPEAVGGLFAFPWPTAYDRDLARFPITSNDALAAEIDRRVRFAVDRGDFSGAILVIKDGVPVYSKAFGLADRDHRVANTMETRFHLGSMDKMFTAIAIGQLIDGGKLSLATKVSEVLPDYPKGEAADAMTIEHLLTHSAGLGGWFDRPAYDRDERFERMTDWLPVFAGEALAFQPGERSSYSNEGYIVLGAVVEAASGTSWYDYVQENIFDRAGMQNTGYPALDEVAANRAVGYLLPPGQPFAREPRKPNWMQLGFRGGSLGGGYSTAGDMARFLVALREGRLISRELAELFTSPATGGLRNYGFGFQSEAVGNRTIRGHDGGGPGAGINSDAKIIWESGDLYAVLGNYDAPFAQTLGDDIGTMLAMMP